MNTAAARYQEMIRARNAQQERFCLPLNEDRWALYAPGYRFDPFREPEPLLKAALALIEPSDDLLEVGGGAGRMGLALMRQARSLVNVEPSAAMRTQFDLCVHDYGIAGARAIASVWPMADPPAADLVLTADVTYFIAEIEPFLRAMIEAALRRVIIFTWTVPPPNINAELFRLAFGEPEAPSPSFQELLPVLWEMGVVPDIQVVDDSFTWPERLPQSDNEALDFVLDELAARDRSSIRDILRPHLGELFQRGPIYQPKWRTPSQGMLITWAV